MTEPHASAKEASDGRWWWIGSVTIIAAVTATVLLYVVQRNYTVKRKPASPLSQSERERAHLLEYLPWRAKWDRAVASGELKLSTQVGFGTGVGKDSQQLFTIFDAQRRDLPRIVEWFRRNYKPGSASIHLTVFVALPVRKTDSLGIDGKPANMVRSRTYKIDANGVQYTGNVSEGCNAKVSQAIDSGALHVFGDPYVQPVASGKAIDGLETLEVNYAHDSDVLTVAEWMSKQMAEADPAIRVHFLQDERQQFKISAGKVEKE